MTCHESVREVPVASGTLTAVSLPHDAPNVIRIGVTHPDGWRFVADLRPADALRLAEVMSDMVHEMRPQ